MSSHPNNYSPTSRDRDADAASLATTAFDWDHHYASQAQVQGNGTGGVRGNPTRQLGQNSGVRLYNLGASGRGGTGNHHFTTRLATQQEGVNEPPNQTAGYGTADYNGEPAVATESFGSTVTDSSAPRRSPTAEHQGLAQKIKNKFSKN